VVNIWNAIWLVMPCSLVKCATRMMAAEFWVHLLSRALMSQSVSVICCTLAHAVFLLHVNIVFT
jgi:hypothetical protein